MQLFLRELKVMGLEVVKYVSVMWIVQLCGFGAMHVCVFSVLWLFQQTVLLVAADIEWPHFNLPLVDSQYKAAQTVFLILGCGGFSDLILLFNYLGFSPHWVGICILLVHRGVLFSWLARDAAVTRCRSGGCLRRWYILLCRWCFGAKQMCILQRTVSDIDQSWTVEVQTVT